MNPKTRRLPKEGPRLTKLANWRDVAAKQEAFNEEIVETTQGVPAGFFDGNPQVVEGGAIASRGAEGDGWSAGRHRHALNVAGSPGVASSAASAQGSGPGVSLSGHTHQVVWDDAGNILATQVFGG